MKILLINNFHYLRGGDCRYTFELAGLLEERGHQVVHFSMHHPQNIPYEYDRYFVSYIDYDAINRNKNVRNIYRVIKTSFWNRESQKKLSALLEVFKPDIAHVQNILHHITPSVIPVLREKGIAVVHHIHDYNLICPDIYLLRRGQICQECFGGNYYKCLINKCKKGSFTASLAASVQRYFHDMRKAFKGVSYFITPTEFTRRKFVESGFFALDRLIAIPHFIRYEEIEPATDSNDAKGVVFAGRLIAEKGIRTLLKAAKLVPNIEITICGDGPLKVEVEKASSQESLKNIKLKGWQSRENIFEAYKKACCAVMPSEWYETAGLSVMEAAATGRASIVSDNTAMAEFISDGQNGMVFEMGNARGLAECIRRMCTNTRMAESMGLNARKLIEQDYSADMHYKKIVDVYLKAVNKT